MHIHIHAYTCMHIYTHIHAFKHACIHAIENNHNLFGPMQLILLSNTEDLTQASLASQASILSLSYTPSPYARNLKCHLGSQVSS